ncbi:hypothetical protein OTU49_011965 [Cherax quadricarinatus]|uniref:Serine hydrolase domain-containing protein n=1 Tax=Cherax quadricarinatus TaxID=27406 RepID=A0AAW0W289_CHEQU
MAGGRERPLRILCLHGYRQNGISFREKTGSFRKMLKKYAEFVYITSPVEVPPIDDGQDKDGGSGWWFSRQDNYFNAQEESECSKGFEESLKAVEVCFKESGPFDGVLGFSQGAAMLGLLCGLQQQGKLTFSFKFAIFASAFRSRSAPHQCLYSEKITLPTLHIYGETDQVIGKDMSEELLQYFHEPETHVHPGGHFVPATAAHKAIYVKFLEDMKQICIV